jgi:hypothetical protein
LCIIQLRIVDRWSQRVGLALNDLTSYTFRS